MRRWLLLLLAALPGVVGVRQPAQAEAATAESPPAITVVQVVRAPLVDRVIASGLVGAVETVEVQPRVTGVAVESVDADVGEVVVAGQVLARLSSAELELERSQLEAARAGAVAAIAQARAQVVAASASADEAARVLDRSQALRAGGNLSQSQLDQANAAATAATAQANVAREGLRAAEAQLTLADARLKDIELRLSRTEVKAPVAGEIIARSATVGAIASSAGAPMFTIVRDGALEVLGDVAEQDVLKLAPGQTAQLRLAGLAEPLPGHVRLVEPRLDPVTRLGRVHIALDDPSRVRPGMFARGTVIVASREALAVPVSALATSADGSSVLKVEAGVVHRATVEIGIRDGQLVEITSGLAAGDQVVAKAGAFVRDGDRITPVSAAAAAGAEGAGR